MNQKPQIFSFVSINIQVWENILIFVVALQLDKN